MSRFRISTFEPEHLKTIFHFFLFFDFSIKTNFPWVELAVRHVKGSITADSLRRFQKLVADHPKKVLNEAEMDQLTFHGNTKSNHTNDVKQKTKFQKFRISVKLDVCHKAYVAVNKCKTKLKYHEYD